MSDPQSSTRLVADVGKQSFDELARDLRTIFGDRLTSLVAYGEADEDGAHTLALVDQVTFADLARCLPLAARWRRQGLATPLILTREEFRRSLDVFPVEYGAIIARHVVLAGTNPFTGIAVAEADLRRGCEQMAKSHLIHLREAFLETSGDPGAIGRLLAASAPSFRTLLTNLDRLEPGAATRAGISESLPAEVTNAADATIADPSALLARYMAAVERIWRYVDAWR
jgi:hypothetical protein